MFQTRIREKYDKLTPGYRRLADFIINHTIEAAFLTTNELARRTQVDQATVVRFSQEIGYPGYRDLVREIKQYVQNQLTHTYQRGEEASSEEELIRTLYQNMDQQLQQYFATETPTLAQAVKVLNQASRVWLTGESISYNLAEVLSRELRYIGIQATAFEPTLTESAMVLENMQPDEVLFAFAIADVSPDTGHVIKLARQKGLKTICLTSYGTTLPAREAEIALVTPIKTPSGLVSFAIPLALIGLIWEALCGLRPEQAMGVAIETFENLGVLRALRAETPPVKTQ
ncbi:MAG TPA: MurR/RpiR family transcriptional regulator [Anaerolineae bacterium]|nr:MurR/RpiR family transcriptional regulator [Anaerolineae bacterium]HQK15184.1 MurR/RpiR family transcriptional regulator [Anaerolineae bacterium]